MLSESFLGAVISGAASNRAECDAGKQKAQEIFRNFSVCADAQRDSGKIWSSGRNGNPIRVNLPPVNARSARECGEQRQSYFICGQAAVFCETVRFEK